MKSRELTAALRNPVLLNLVGAIWTVDRVYELMLKDKQAWGHFIVAVTFLAGFLIGILALLVRGDSHDEKRKRLVRICGCVSYVILCGGVVLLAIVMRNDVAGGLQPR